MILRVERWLSSQEHSLLWQRIQALFLAPSWCPQLSDDRMPASGLCGHCTHTVHRYTRRQKRLYTKKYKFLKTPDELRRVHFQHRKAFLCEQVLQRAFPELVVWVRFNQSNLQNILGGAETV